MRGYEHYPRGGREALAPTPGLSHFRRHGKGEEFPEFSESRKKREGPPRWGGSAYALLAPLGASAHPRLGVCADALMAREEVEYSPRQRCLTTLGRPAGHTPGHRRKHR